MEKPLEAKVDETLAQPSPEDFATRDYMILFPRFLEEIEELSNRQLKKVVSAIIEYPFNGRIENWSYEKEQKAFLTGVKLMDAKYTIFNAVKALKKEEIEKILEETKPEPKKEVIVSTDNNAVVE